MTMIITSYEMVRPILCIHDDRIINQTEQLNVEWMHIDEEAKKKKK